MRALRPVLSVIERDARVALSYRLSAVLTVASTCFGVALWYFLSRAVTPAAPGWAQGGYFGYLVVGTALMGYVNLALYSFGHRLREDQITGTLEVLLGSPSPAYCVFSASILWEMAVQTLQVAATVAIALLFGLELQVGSVAALLLVTGLTVVAFASLGLTAASLLLIFKRGEPVTPFIGALFALLGGVFFPPSVLPAPLAALSKCLPLPYALEALRGILLEGWGFARCLPDALALAGFAALLLPLSLATFPFCLRVARRYGLVSTY